MFDDAPLVFQATLADVPGAYNLQDVEQMRIVLNGTSVIDWRRLAFTRHDQIDDFLRVSGFELSDPTDRLQLDSVHRRALDYLTRNFGLKLHSGVVDLDDPRDLFLLASQPGPAQRDACRVLKVMHVIHHVDGRELLFRMPIALSELFHRVEQRVFRALDGMKANGVRIAEFSGSRKTADSILTKLLARRDSLAAEVHDKLRFRVVTEALSDAFGALVYLSSHLFPFNYVVPGASRNDLVDFRRTLEGDPGLSALVDLLHLPVDFEEKLERAHQNIFSAAGFKMINFVVDIPVRVDDLVEDMPGYRPEWGRVVFCLVEFQLMDRQTDENNNTGDNRHSLYKARQHVRVLERLNGSSGP
ncbi:TIGR04552 family protein [Myxococcota bacterium]|jgi:uncharacterized protein (TIGR04552 family)|nr:TIGR04552 family protein [Myxococcota bacterium]